MTNQKKTIKKLKLKIFYTVLLGIIIFGGWSYFRAGNQNLENNNSILGAISNSSSISTSSEKPKPIPTTITSNTLFFGDVFWGRYIDDWSKASELKTAYPFSGLNTLERDKYDAWIGGLECPITDTYLDSKTQDNLLKFSCPSEYTTEAAKWFTAFTLANNHIDNMQEVDGLKQTRDNLNKNNIQYFGHYDNAVKSDICEIISLPVKVTFNDNSKDNQNLPFALCGFHNVFKLPKEDELAVIKEYSKYFITITMPHQGQEYKYKADSLQTSYAKKMIDLGADAVIGNHVHTVQNTESYKGKLIVYSLGNFIFDQQASPQVREAFGTNLNFSFDYDLNLQKYLDIAPNCKAFQDNCLKLAQQENLTKPKANIVYDIIPTDNSNKLAKKASPEISKKILNLTNWTTTQSQLSPTL